MNLVSLLKAKNISLLFIAGLCLANCGTKVQTAKWDQIIIDSMIRKSAVFMELDKQPEIFSMHEKKDSGWKRTSDVAYAVFPTNQLEKEKYTRFNNCRAYFLPPHTLRIEIGIRTGFGGRGFVICRKDKSFYTEPFYITDVVSDDDGSTYKIMYQNLVLDKPAYTVGDSLYGYVEFKSIETVNNGEQYTHHGKGHFRTKVLSRR